MHTTFAAKRLQDKAMCMTTKSRGLSTNGKYPNPLIVANKITATQLICMKTEGHMHIYTEVTFFNPYLSIISSEQNYSTLISAQIYLFIN